MLRLIIYCSLLFLSTQRFLRKTIENNELFFCFPKDSPQTDNNNNGIDILCYGEECYGVMNSNRTSEFINVTVLCNQISCRIIENSEDDSEEEKCHPNEIFDNCITITLICFNGKCIGGPIQNDNDGNNGGNNNNQNNNSDNNNDDDNTTIIVIRCLNNICNKDEVEDIDNNNNGISCENNKCSFELNEKEPKDPKHPNDSKDTKCYKNKNCIIFIIISFSYVLFIIIDFILICKCSSFICQCSCEFLTIIFFIIFFAPIFFIIFICCCRGNSNKRKGDNSDKHPPDIDSSNYSKSDFEEINTEKSSIERLIETKEEEDKKKVIIQTHSKFCDIEKVNKELYLVNREEIKISFILSQSLKLTSEDISIYTFNIAQYNLLKERLKKELSFIKIILLNQYCTNFTSSDYIIINYIDSPISEESKSKYPNFKSNLNSRQYYKEEFTNNILESYTKKMLYIVCNDEYLKKPVESIEEDEISYSNKGITLTKVNSKKNKIPIAKIYREIQVKKIDRKFVTNEYNVCFIIDNTSSMGDWIDIIKNICNDIFEKIIEKYTKYKFYFGSVLYADKLSCKTDINYKINFTQNKDEFKSKLEEINQQDGGDCAEDWVSGFQIALDELNWGNGTKLIFHIADAPQHGKYFNTDKKDDDFLNDENDINGKNLLKLIKRLSERNIKITGISIDNVCSFKVFKKEYEKVNGPKYEIIELEGMELNMGNECMNKKILDIIEKSVNENKTDDNNIIV